MPEVMIAPLDAESGQAHPGTGHNGGAMVTLSLVLIRFLAAYGIAVGKLGEFVSQVMATLSVPEEQQAAVKAWLVENAGVSEANATAMALLIYEEIKGGKPGYDPQHAGGA